MRWPKERKSFKDRWKERPFTLHRMHIQNVNEYTLHKINKILLLMKHAYRLLQLKLKSFDILKVMLLNN